jgi:hypothetical protein
MHYQTKNTIILRKQSVFFYHLNYSVCVCVCVCVCVWVCVCVCVCVCCACNNDRNCLFTTLVDLVWTIWSVSTERVHVKPLARVGEICVRDGCSRISGHLWIKGRSLKGHALSCIHSANNRNSFYCLFFFFLCDLEKCIFCLFFFCDLEKCIFLSSFILWLREISLLSSFILWIRKILVNAFFNSVNKRIKLYWLLFFCN